MTEESQDVEWGVEMVDDEVHLTVADDDDVVVYMMDPVEAALLAAAIFDTLEEKPSD
jgi:hypothetical protein